MTEGDRTNAMDSDFNPSEHVTHTPAPAITARLRPQRRRVVPAGLRAYSSVWSVSGDPEALVRLDVCEAASALDADRQVLRVLANVESPVFLRDAASDELSGEQALLAAEGIGSSGLREPRRHEVGEG